MEECVADLLATAEHIEEGLFATTTVVCVGEYCDELTDRACNNGVDGRTCQLYIVAGGDKA